MLQIQKCSIIHLDLHSDLMSFNAFVHDHTQKEFEVHNGKKTLPNVWQTHDQANGLLSRVINLYYPQATQALIRSPHYSLLYSLSSILSPLFSLLYSLSSILSPLFSLLYSLFLLFLPFQSPLLPTRTAPPTAYL